MSTDSTYERLLSAAARSLIARLPESMGQATGDDSGAIATILGGCAEANSAAHDLVRELITAVEDRRAGGDDAMWDYLTAEERRRLSLTVERAEDARDASEMLRAWDQRAWATYSRECSRSVDELKGEIDARVQDLLEQRRERWAWELVKVYEPSSYEVVWRERQARAGGDRLCRSVRAPLYA
ncbi:MAG: hypothetical protein ACRDPA_13800, partial [Solirubrobacteraceae bacterium]